MSQPPTNVPTAASPLVPTSVGAAGTQVAGSSSPPPQVASGSLFGGSGVTTSSQWITTSATAPNNVIVVGNYPQKVRRPRRPREKRQVPLFTAGLEAKLNKCLDKDPTKILRYISRKVGQPPKVDDTNPAETVYEYSTMFQYVIQNGINWGAQVNGTFPQVDKHTVKFFARLVCTNEGMLREYEVRMGGSKQ